MDKEQMSKWRWALYAGALITGVFIPVFGSLVEAIGGGWVISMTILYILWIVFFGAFCFTFFEPSSKFISLCLYYLVCSLPPLAFFGSLRDDLHLWLPASLSFGIFVGLGIWSCITIFARHVRLMALQYRVGAPLLPTHRTSTSSTAVTGHPNRSTEAPTSEQSRSTQTLAFSDQDHSTGT